MPVINLIRHAWVWLFAGLVLSLSPSSLGWCGSPVAQLDFTLPAPQAAQERAYLGVSSQFHLGQVKADVLIIEVFSMYCPVCQREASNVNSLFDLIRKNKALRDRVKMIGIGAGNSDFEVAFFKDKYKIGFPLFSDADFSLHKKIGEVRTPHFFGLILNPDQSFSLFYSESGEIKDPVQFLKQILEKSKTDIVP